MIGILATIALRLAACSLLSWAVWRWFGPAPMVATAPLFGIALARPLIDLASEVRRAMHHAHWRDVQGALAVAYPDGVRRLGRPAEPYLRDEALLAHLAKERSPEARRLSTWVGREIVFPARRERERLGIRAAAASDIPD